MTKVGYFWVAAIASLGVLASSVPSPSLAQESSPSIPDNSVCMMRMVANVEGNGVEPFNVMLLQSDVRAMSAVGFVITPCTGAFASRAHMIRWRDDICKITATAAEPIQEMLARRLGARPAVFCGMAQQVLGQWDRRGGAK
jgi:hypothetical protein